MKKNFQKYPKTFKSQYLVKLVNLIAKQARKNCSNVIKLKLFSFCPKKGDFQDAQEFSQLFLSMIQSILTSSSDLNPPDDQIENLSSFRSSPNSDLIHDLFQGEYQYLTEHVFLCNNCKLQSARNSNFFELTLGIQNVQSINDCINELLDEELMQGDNQYFCDNCQHKTDAKRCTKISNLPPILNLQLLRFVYDRNSGLKKKLSNKVRFCEILDLSSLVDSQQTSATTYHLGAILMHVGKTAYSGHYTAQIKKFQSNEWFNFNDEIITKIKKKNLLGQSTEDGFETAEKSDKSDSNDKKAFSSSNAYLLVYYRSDLVEKIPKENCVRSSNQSEIVQVDNQLLENWFNNLSSDTIGQKEIKNTQRTQIHSIYENLWLNKSQKKAKSKDSPSSPQHASMAEKELYYFVPVDFVRKLIAGEFSQIQNELPSVTNKYLCAHKRLNPLAINRFKLVSRKGLDIFCEKNSANLSDIGALEAFNNSTTRCWPCVFNCFDYLKFKDDIKQDMKKVRQMLKYEFDEQKAARSDEDVIFIEKADYQDNKENRNVSDTWYWVGKESLKQWQNLAIKKIESQLPSVKFAELPDSKPDIIEEPNGNEADNDVQELASFPHSSNNMTGLNSNNSLKYFNEDVICPHNDLAPGPNKRLPDISESLDEEDTETRSTINFDINKKCLFTNQSNECKICMVRLLNYLLFLNQIIHIKLEKTLKYGKLNKSIELDLNF
ncbi:ubiquitin carboxyl-terminal hydrolase 48 isoform X1 [Brachionus plicatilis]|uniref:ubiquitinyl hydrolase 1 n=1 Tax=Brachionus plicatilis TaxID=10195 RepID=A0A3M7QE80_BRAPC|nr:ubiquitin carboxyl-terminal hydrolase 48 isoform X1 [Brachionus plicatilis]